MTYLSIDWTGGMGGATARRLLLGAVLTAVWPAAPAVAASDTRVDIGPCMDIAATLERFACYEGLAEQVRQRRETADTAAPRQGKEQNTALPPAAQTPAGEEEANRRSPPVAVGDDFGLPLEPEPEPEQASAQVLHAGIADLDEFKPNHWRITLDNGQVWQQVVGKRFHLRKGFQVNIREGGWGDNYRLDADETKGHIQVRRLR